MAYFAYNHPDMGKGQRQTRSTMNPRKHDGKPDSIVPTSFQMNVRFKFDNRYTFVTFHHKYCNTISVLREIRT